MTEISNPLFTVHFLANFLNVIYRSNVERQPGGNNYDNSRSIQEVKRANLGAFANFFGEIASGISTTLLRQFTEFKVDDNKNIEGLSELLSEIHINL